MSRPREFTEARVQTALRLPKTLHVRLCTAAYERQLPVNRLCEMAIAEFLDRLIPVSELKLTRDR